MKISDFFSSLLILMLDKLNAHMLVCRKESGKI